MAEGLGWEVLESLSAAAQPAGTTVKEGFRDEILSNLATHLPDIFLITIHGPMVADGYDDCEGDMMARAEVAWT